ncbi:MAG: hypothetical protein L3J33_06215, partial [Rhodobacteraceae bacterium]|nr:hypothetical protein [Paracoccaceae bacterium]
ELNTPILSAIGHEEDSSIADFVSDIVAITPTAAAHLLAGDFKKLVTNLQHAHIQLNQHITSTIKNQQQSLDLQLQTLKTVHPKQQITLQKQQLSNQKTRMNSILTNKLKTNKQSFSLLKQKLYNNTPDIEFAKTIIKQQINKLNHLSNLRFTESKNQHLLAMTKLNDQNPLKILSQGYSYTTNLDDNRSTVTSNKQVKKGSRIETILKSGRIYAKITEHFDE